MATFDDAKVGDRAWSYKSGWGIIKKIAYTDTHPLWVEFKDISTVGSYTLEGKSVLQDLNPTLFWDEIKIVPPERPIRCRKCDKTIDPSINTLDGLCSICWCEKPKEKCKGCEAERLIAEDIDWLPAPRRVLNIILNNPQHHTCEKGEK